MLCTKKWAIEWHQALSSQNSGTCHLPRVWVRNLPENGTLAHLGPYGTRTAPARNTKWVQSVSGWVRLAVTWSRGARAIARAPPGGHFCAKCDRYMVFLDGLWLHFNNSRDQRSVGWQTGAWDRVTTWRTWSPEVLRCEDILPQSENLIFCAFCMFRRPQIANGGIDADHISHGDGHVNGSSTRAHKASPPTTFVARARRCQTLQMAITLANVVRFWPNLVGLCTSVRRV